MRTATINLAGEEHLLCLSTRVVRSCAERYGGMDKVFDALGDEDAARALDECLWLLAQLMDAGARYAAMTGQKTGKPLTVDDLLDGCGVDDLRGLRGKIVETITAGTERTVEAEPPKNAAATPGSR